MSKPLPTIPDLRLTPVKTDKPTVQVLSIKGRYALYPDNEVIQVEFLDRLKIKKLSHSCPKKDDE